MNSEAVNPSASEQLENSAKPIRQFAGFEPLTANYVYCPNQFFDVCLKSNSRGMVRIVAYILRQTLGWLDKNGEPINQTVKVSYSDLITKAGVSRGAIKKALQQAVALGFLECQQSGVANARNQSGQSARYTLRWDFADSYRTTLSDFQGFFAGQGNRTPIPNAYFDTVIRNNSLAIIKVVGAIIRNSVGYQNQFGHRRQSVSLSYSDLKRHTGLSDRSTLSDAIKASLKAGFIERVEAGIFDSDAKVQSAAEYGIKWLAHNKNKDGSLKTRPEPMENLERFKNQTKDGIKTRPAERFKNQTSIEKTENKNFKQQSVVAEKKLLQQLVEVGFSADTAKSMIVSRGVEVVARQLNWIDARKPKNKIGMLRKAIEQDWDTPESVKAKSKREASHRKFDDRTAQLEKEDRDAANRKKRRHQRKTTLLAEWERLTIPERQEWISAAAKRQTAEVLRKIILRESPESKIPSFHVLDELAMSKGLPTVSLVE